MKKLLLFLTLLLSSVFYVGCKARPEQGASAVTAYTRDPLNIRVPDSYSKSDVLRIMENVLRGRQWAVTGSTANSVKGNLVHNNIDANVELVYENGYVVIKDTGSTYDNPRTEDITVPAIPSRWYRFLKADLIKALP